MRSGNAPLKFKAMGASPMKNLGIFDSQGNRISMDDALSLEEAGENVTYTELDAVKRAQMKRDDDATKRPEGKIWQKEVSDQIIEMEKRGSAEDKSLVEELKGDEGKTKGELYTEYHEWDKKLQDMIKSGEYAKLSEEEKIELEAKAGRTKRRGEGFIGDQDVKIKANFPTTGQISGTQSKVDELKDLGII